MTDKFDESGPWETEYEGTAVNIASEKYCSFIKENGIYGRALPIPEELRISPGRKVKIIIKVEQ